jgi:ribonuclease P protein component
MVDLADCLTQQPLSFKLETLKRRAEFQRIRGGVRAATPRFVLEGKMRPQANQAAGSSGGPDVRFGFTVTKQMGNAVTRNRIKRRLRAALSLTANHAATDGYDYVIIARSAALACEFQLLIDDFVAGFARVHHTAANPAANPVKPRGSTGKSAKSR